VHGKGSLLSRMAGDDWQKRANLRLLLGYQWTQPGKKLLFSGGELGQPPEWDHDGQVMLHLVEEPAHGGVQQLVGDLNRLYRTVGALHERDCDADGFEWIEADNAEESIIAFLRWGRADAPVLVVANFTPMPRLNHRVGSPIAGAWRELLNSDAPIYGGAGFGNLGEVETVPVPMHGRTHSLMLTVPPLGIVLLEPC
jgi:1,4-alpha-glucan branching enzyme